MHAAIYSAIANNFIAVIANIIRINAYSKEKETIYFKKKEKKMKTICVYL